MPKREHGCCANAPRSDLAADPLLPDETRLWAALQDVSGGTWGGSVFDVDRFSPCSRRGGGRWIPDIAAHDKRETSAASPPGR